MVQRLELQSVGDGLEHLCLLVTCTRRREPHGGDVRRNLDQLEPEKFYIGHRRIQNAHVSMTRKTFVTRSSATGLRPDVSEQETVPMYGRCLHAFCGWKETGLIDEWQLTADPCGPRPAER